MDRQFVWGLRYIDDLICRDRFVSPGVETLYASHDQWHVTAVYDSSGGVSERYSYKAFGESTVQTAAFAVRTASLVDWETRYGAYRWDRESGLYCVRYRMLHAGLGRWSNRDFWDNPFEYNHYWYVINSPVSFCDPHGLKEKSANTEVKPESCYISIVMGHCNADGQVRATLAKAADMLKSKQDSKCIKHVYAGISCFPKSTNNDFEETCPNNSLKGLGELLGLLEDLDGYLYVSADPESPDDTVSDAVYKTMPLAIAKAEEMCNQPCCKDVKIQFFITNPRIPTKEKPTDDVAKALRSEAWTKLRERQHLMLNCKTKTWSFPKK